MRDDVQSRSCEPSRAAAAFGPLFKMTEGPASGQVKSGAMNKYAAPSDLKITDIRGITIDPGWTMHDFPVIRIDTNPGGLRLR